MFRTPLPLLALGASIALAGCGDNAFAPEFGVTTDSFAQFDLDGDALLSPSEFESGFAARGVFESYDTDLSGSIEEDEFESDLGDFDDFDVDADLVLDEGEFLQGAFAAFDEDLDGFVNELEFEAGLDRL